MGTRFHDLWMAKHVRVKGGPFKDWEGVVCMTDGPKAGRLRVAFPRDEPEMERMWFNRSDLKRVTTVV